MDSSKNVQESLSMKIPSLLHDDKFQEALILVNKEENLAHLKQDAWDLVPHLCDPLTSDNEREKPELIETCEAILLKLVKVGNPKEILLVLLEQADSFKDDVKFRCLLLPIQRCLQTLPSKKSNSLAIALETLYAHFLTIDPPEEIDVEGKERAFLDCDENVRRSNDTVGAMIIFLEPFVEEVKCKNFQDEESREKARKEVRELMIFIIKMLDKPMSALDLTFIPKDEKEIKKALPKSISRVLAEKLMQLASKLDPDLFTFLIDILKNNQRIIARKEKESRKQATSIEAGDAMDDLEVEDPVPFIGLAVLSYLVFGENLGSDDLPSIYTHEYRFEFNTVFIKTLLARHENLLVEKGAILLESTLKLIKDSSLSVFFMDHVHTKEMIQALLTVVCVGKVKDTSRRCVTLVGLFCTKLTPAGKHRFLLFIFNKFNHCGLIGYAITLLKTELDFNLNQEEIDPHFKGKLLETILNHVFALPSGAETDLLKNHEWIMGALNLLRYLVIKDPKAKNATGIWDHQIQTIRDKYIECLHKGIEISRAHYKLDIEKVKKGENAGIPELSFRVGNESTPEMDKKQQIEMLQMAVHTFDMMESILSRVNELMDQQK